MKDLTDCIIMILNLSNSVLSFVFRMILATLLRERHGEVVGGRGEEGRSTIPGRNKDASIGFVSNVGPMGIH